MHRLIHICVCINWADEPPDSECLPSPVAYGQMQLKGGMYSSNFSFLVFCQAVGVPYLE